MTPFAVHYSYTDDVDFRMALRPEHRDFLLGLGPERLLLAAAYDPTEEHGGLLIIGGTSVEEVTELMSADPYQQQGVVTDVRIRTWQPAIGSGLTV
ncbi:MAG: YciI family protein [Propionibacteriaceae bacterium]|nr:YciI family protein [Propionibacteriaceae bacterium]